MPYAEIMRQIRIGAFPVIRDAMHMEWQERHVMRGFDSKSRDPIIVRLKECTASFAIGITPLEHAMLHRATKTDSTEIVETIETIRFLAPAAYQAWEAACNAKDEEEVENNLAMLIGKIPAQFAKKRILMPVEAHCVSLFEKLCELVGDVATLWPCHVTPNRDK